MSLIDIFNTALAIAINNRLISDEEYFYRKMCRFYSKTFNTNLEEVFNLDPYKVLLAYYEESIDTFDLDADQDINQLLDKIYTLKDPDYVKNKEEDIEQYIKRLEQQQIKKEELKKEEPKKSLSETKIKENKELPTEGYINLSYLEKLEKESGGEF